MTQTGSMGLKGMWAQMLNATAVGLICVMFYQDRHAAFDAAREDREMFRAELRNLHHDSERLWQAYQRQAAVSQQQTEAIQKIAEELRDLRGLRAAKKEPQP